MKDNLLYSMGSVLRNPWRKRENYNKETEAIITTNTSKKREPLGFKIKTKSNHNQHEWPKRKRSSANRPGAKRRTKTKPRDELGRSRSLGFFIWVKGKDTSRQRVKALSCVLLPKCSARPWSADKQLHIHRGSNHTMSVYCVGLHTTGVSLMKTRFVSN